MVQHFRGSEIPDASREVTASGEPSSIVVLLLGERVSDRVALIKFRELLESRSSGNIFDLAYLPLSEPSVDDSNATSRNAAQEAWVVVPFERDLVPLAPQALNDWLAQRLEQFVLIAHELAEFPTFWEERLVRPFLHDSRLAAVSALCDCDPIFSALPEKSHANASVAVLDSWIYNVGDHTVHDVPSFHGNATLVRREALLRVSTISQASRDVAQWVNDISKAMRACGFTVAVCDTIYVGANTSVGISIDAVERAAYATQSTLAPLQRHIQELDRGAAPQLPMAGLSSKPVQLHIAHYWGGGVERWVRSFMRSDSTNANLLLTTYRIGEKGGQRIELHADASGKHPIRSWDIAQPIRSTLGTCEAYRRVLNEVVSLFAVDRVIVSSLIGHTLDVLRLPLPTVYVWHDFFPICEAINPSFRGKTCSTCTRTDLAACRAENPLNVFFDDHSLNEWVILREAFVAELTRRSIVGVVPTPSVRQTLQTIVPELAQARFEHIEHGSGASMSPIDYNGRKGDEKLRVAIIGRLPANKGRKLLEDAAAALNEFCHIFLIGSGKHTAELAANNGWDHIEQFDEAELQGLLTRIRPHVSAHLSVVPETFSYTLSEAMAAGVPPIATRLGSFVDRVEHGVDGLLFDATPHDLVSTLRHAYDKPELLMRIANNLAAYRPRDMRSMLSAYDDLFPDTTLGCARYSQARLPKSAQHDAYMQAHRAYTEVQSAYDAVRVGYDQLRTAYDHASGEYQRVLALYTNATAANETAQHSLRTRVEALEAEFESLRVLWQRYRHPATAFGRLVQGSQRAALDRAFDEKLGRDIPLSR